MGSGGPAGSKSQGVPIPMATGYVTDWSHTRADALVRELSDLFRFPVGGIEWLREEDLILDFRSLQLT